MKDKKTKRKEKGIVMNFTQRMKGNMERQQDYFVVMEGKNGTEKIGKYITFSDMLAITDENYQKFRDEKDEKEEAELSQYFVSTEHLIAIDGGVTFVDKNGTYYNTKVPKENKSLVLPRHAGVSRQLRLGIIGSPYCGKTLLQYQFNTILRSEFARKVSGFRILNDMLDFSLASLEFKRQVQDLSEGILPDPNKTEEISNTLSFLVKYQNQEVLLEFQDISGEEADRGRNLFYDAYIILISAEEIVSVNRSDELEHSITNLIYETFKRQEREHVPVFVGITKSDLLLKKEDLSEDMMKILLENSLEKDKNGKIIQKRHLYGYDRAYGAYESKAVAQMIRDEIPNFYNVLEDLKTADDVQFFSLASLNFQPEGNKIQTEYLPFNIDEIFLAVLSEFQLYPLKEQIMELEEQEEEPLERFEKIKEPKVLTDVVKQLFRVKRKG